MTDNPSRPFPLGTFAPHHADSGSEPPRAVHVTSPPGLIQAVPYLLGFHPGQDMVIIGTRPPRNVATITLRYSLPNPADPGKVAATAHGAIETLNAQQYQTALAIGFGPDKLARPFAEQLQREAEPYELSFKYILRADTQQQRYWSYLPTDPDRRPPQGTPYESPPDAAITGLFADDVPGVLASREAIAEVVAPCSGEEAASMTEATVKAQRRLARPATRAPRPGKPPGKRAVALAGIRATEQAIRKYRQGATITHAEAAWLTVLLRDLRVRDDAWSRVNLADRNVHLRLWIDLTRLAQFSYVPAPATLLAFTAWRVGNNPLAQQALARALAADPNYPMAAIMRNALGTSMTPGDIDPPVTPEWVAESYAEHYPEQEPPTDREP